MSDAPSPLSVTFEKAKELLTVWFDYPGMQGQLSLGGDEGEAFLAWLRDAPQTMPSIGIPLPGSHRPDAFLPDAKVIAEEHFGFKTADRLFRAFLFYDVEYGQPTLEIRAGQYLHCSFLGPQAMDWLRSAREVIEYVQP